MKSCQKHRMVSSVTTALYHFVNNIYKVFEGENILGILGDLTKAFDTVDHSVLLYKLEKFGVRSLA